MKRLADRSSKLNTALCSAKLPGGLRNLCIVGLVISTSVITGCNNATQSIPESSYFPLNEGLEWQYSTIKRTDEGVTRGEYLIGSTGITTDFEESLLTRIDGYGTRFYFRADESGIYRLGKQNLISRDIQYDAKPRYVLPSPVTIGKSWFADSHPYVLQRLYPVRETFTRQNVFQMSYSVLDTAAQIEVPAGRYENCIHVRGTGTATVLADLVKGRYGASDAEIITDEWYALGVGLVKLVRTEVFPNELFADGTYTMELIRFGGS